MSQQQRTGVPAVLPALDRAARFIRDHLAVRLLIY